MAAEDRCPRAPAPERAVAGLQPFRAQADVWPEPDQEGMAVAAAQGVQAEAARARRRYDRDVGEGKRDRARGRQVAAVRDRGLPGRREPEAQLLGEAHEEHAARPVGAPETARGSCGRQYTIER